MWETILSNQPWHGEVINKRKNGQLYYESLQITPVSDDHGNITHFIAIKEDISDRKRAEEEMEHLAFYDPLTDLPNRRLLMDRIERAIVSAKRYQTFGAIFFLDLDYFKRINDELGHDVGDLLLQDMARRLQNSLRQGDSIARLGGDEFVILLEDLGDTKTFATQYMKALAQKVQDAFIDPFIYNEKSYSLSISLGGILFTGTQDAKIILKNADSALYEAKQTGRHKSCFYNENT
ncbi:putative signaling protein [Sulfurospirillum diekertiae]|nr:putative signaling protein [Sulfurospirillum diekertiae]